MSSAKKNVENSSVERTEGKREKTTRLQLRDGSGNATGLQWPMPAKQKRAVEDFNLEMFFSIPEGRAERAVSRRSFKEPHMYYAFMADKYTRMAERYKEVAKDAKEHPEVYKSNRASVKERIAQMESTLEQRLQKGAQALVEKLGCTLEEALEMLQ